MKSEKEYIKITRTPFRYVLIMLMAALSINILGLALPLTMKQIYSRVIIHESRDTLIVLLIGCGIALLLESVVKRTEEIVSKWISCKYEYLLSGFLGKKVLNIQEMEGVNLSPHANLERFKSVASIASFYSRGFYKILIDLPFVLLFLYLIFFIGGSLIIVPISMIIIYIVIMIFNTREYVKRRKYQLEATEDVMAHLSQSLVKIHLIKAGAIEEFVISKFKDKLRKLTETEYRVNQFKMLPNNVSGYITQLNLFTTFCYGGYLLIRGQVFFGEITACALLGGRAISPLVSFMRLYMQNKDIKMQKSRIEELALAKEQYSEDTPDFPDDINGTIEMISLGYYDIQKGEKLYMDEIIKMGSFVHIDTKEFLSYRQILDCLVGKTAIKEGKILIDSMDISKWNMDTLKGKVEYVTESVPIFKGSIMDNITLFDISKNRDVYEAAAFTGLDKIVMMMPEGFETQLDNQSRNSLQSSFMQRLNLTRALLYRPRILVIDRIDSSMDYETLETFMWILSRIKGSVTILIATENKDIIEMADAILTRGGMQIA